MSDPRKTVFITGSSGIGIGNHLARVFHENGYRVFATARNTDSLNSLASKGIEVMSLTVDDHESVVACYEDLRRRLNGKGLDYLIHNAGTNYTVPIDDLNIDDAKAMYNTNLFAIMDINQVFLELLLQSQSTIVNIGSVAGTMPYIYGSVYNSSKAALHSYADTLRVELSPFNVHVVTVVTGGVKSNIARTERRLKPGSLFEGFEAGYQRRVKHSQEVGMDTMVYAKTVFRGVTTSRGWLWNRNEVWAGGAVKRVRLAHFIDRWFPGGIWGFIMRNMVGIQHAGRNWRKKQH